VISCGNQADLKVTDYLRYFGDDPQTAFIGAYIEGIFDGREFLKQAREASRKKPVVIWKAGSSDAGARAVASHTASMAGEDTVWTAALRQAGVIRADHFDELVDFAAAFGCPFLPEGDRVGILVEAGGGGASASDALESTGLCICEFPNSFQAQMMDCLKGVAAPFSSLKNPVDLVSPKRDQHPRIMPRLIELIACKVDTVLFFTYYPLDEEKFLNLLTTLRDKIQKPIFIVPGYPTRQIEGMTLYNRHGIPALPTTERAAKAIAALHSRAQWLKANPG
jgi:acyl-CoA synthetase (NDP forming)